ncbi:MAG: EAL domain-containing protein [Parasporobacterium sp.]|nr:EAL domain-containing protein [Parasporobacterium sp.]
MKDKRTLLIIEDNEINREMLAALLEDSYNILKAEHGAQGIEILNERGQEISLILLDIQMPVMDGKEFLNAVTNDRRFADIPIIVTTASDSDDEQIDCLSLGASDFVVKPYKPEIVQKRVEGLIRLRETALQLHKVETDQVTGLYNREAFAYYAHQMVQSGTSEAYDMVCFEVNSFVSLQGKYGTPKCTEVLKNIADYLQPTMDNTAILGRIDVARIAALFSHLPQELHTEFSGTFSDQVFSDTIPSIDINTGVYLNVDKNTSISAMLANAISPIEGIRDHYGKHIAFYDDELRAKQNYTQQLIDSADEGISKRQFQVYYQPKHSAESGTIGGAEALIRWIHPEFGFISPGAFIPAFEKNGFIPKIDLYVVDTVCADLRRWIDEGKKVVPVSANISQMDFDIPDLADLLEAIVDKYYLPRDLVHFEITESADSGNTDKKMAAVAKLREKGFKIELDDFGSGYSNLSAMAEMPVDVIKLDMTLVRGMFEKDHSAVLKGVLYTVAALGKKLVAEGVETIEQVNGLKDLCAGRIDLYYQGYYFSKPLPVDQFETYLNN